MTMEELKQLIEEIVDQRLAALLEQDETDTRTMEEIFASIERNRWTPPPGTKSSQELLREDRDR
ncbi:MAG: hypothetical protein F9K27_17075 [Anaerolineae bacterium]|nr:MAG: hypothetical protein F9K27_17075 [Anaerolineae bacterium]